MIIDFHTHIFPDALASSAIESIKSGSDAHMQNHLDGTLSALLSSMKKNKIGKSVILPIATKPVQTDTINKWALDVQENYPEIISFGTCHPQYSDYKEAFRFMRIHGIKGVKFHPIYQDFDLNDPKMMLMFYAAAREGLILMFHIGADPKKSTRDSSPKSLHEIAHELNSAKIVAAHLGGLDQWDEVEQHLAGMPNIYFDTAMIKGRIVNKQFGSIVNRHGKNRILFGTDSPWVDQGDYINMIKALNLNKNDEQLILSKNALTLLGMEE